VALNLTLDYLVLDALEPVTYFVRTGPATPVTGGVVVNNALSVTRIKMESSNIGLLGQDNVTWHLWQNELGTIAPVTGDVVQDKQGVRWSVTHETFEALTGHWALETTRER
jgi:hypothetical protein